MQRPTPPFAQYLFPLVDKVRFPLDPAKCRLHRENDMLLRQEEEKVEQENGIWQCRICRKQFREEEHIDKHMGNRHPQVVYPVSPAGESLLRPLWYPRAFRLVVLDWFEIIACGLCERGNLSRRCWKHFGEEYMDKQVGNRRPANSCIQ